MDFDLDEEISGLIDEIDEWAIQQTKLIEENAQKGEVAIHFLTPQDFFTECETNSGLMLTADDNFLIFGQEEEEKDSLESRSHLQYDCEEANQFAALKARSDACDVLLSQVNRALHDLDFLEAQHRLVSDKTHSLHEVCKRLLSEQTKLDKIVSGIQSPMYYFTALDEIRGRFESNSGVKQHHPDDEQFHKDLKRMDECVQFLNHHLHYHDAREYLSKFFAVQHLGMKMIESWAIAELIRLQQQQASHPSHFHASDKFLLDDPSLYFRYAEKGKVLRNSLLELEKRPLVSFDSLHAVFHKLCMLRTTLLTPVMKKSPEFTSPQNTVVSRILLGSEFLGRVCLAEYNLLSTFFSLTVVRNIYKQHNSRQHHKQHAEGLADEDDEEDGGSAVIVRDPFFVEMEFLATFLFDSVRPLIVLETNLETLCDAASAVESASEDLLSKMESEVVEPLDNCLTKIALDLQERICFLCLRIVREEIAPMGKHQRLDHPSVFTAAEWFPSLELSLSTLSKVYRTVDFVVFEQLAAETVSACTKSLCDFAKRLPGLDDGDLFLVKHLLILREQISPFRAVLMSRERKIDFLTPLKHLFVKNGNSGTVKPSGGLFSMLRFAVPQVQEEDLNTKRELDLELKQASERFILRVSKRALGPLLEFVDASQAFLQREDCTWESFQLQDFAQVQEVKKALLFCETNMLLEITRGKERALLFLTNAQTRQVLFHAVESNAFKIVNTASNYALDLFKEDIELNERLRELVRQVAGSASTSLAEQDE